MAKIIIPFNNKEYSVDESAFSDAYVALKSHLSAIMNGSGATISFGGTDYNIDSAKLSAATNDFITHLGTVAGSGKKVVIGGVEYNVDSAKMNSAIAELETVLGDLHTGNDDSSETVIFAEQTLTGFTVYADYGMGQYDINPAPFALVLGETYTVVWDGVEYECVATFTTQLSTGEEALGLGNLSAAGFSGGNDEVPFFIGCSTAGVSLLALDTETEHTVAIYKVN